MCLSKSLLPGQKYYYVVGDNCTWSEEYIFTAPPSTNQTFVLVAYGGKTKSLEAERFSCGHACQIESGCAQVDGSHHINEHRSSLNVTTSVYDQLENIDLLLHLGGLSFAKGYSSVVSGNDYQNPALLCFKLSLAVGQFL